MKNAAFRLAAASIFTLSTVFTTAFAADPKTPDPSPWSFLEGSWAATSPAGETYEFTCRVNDSKTCYILTSANFHGTFGIDPSSDHPMLSLSYLPGTGYSIGHWKRESDTKVSGGFWIVDIAGKKVEHTSVFEKTADGFTYTIDMYTAGEESSNDGKCAPFDDVLFFSLRGRSTKMKTTIRTGGRTVVILVALNVAAMLVSTAGFAAPTIKPGKAFSIIHPSGDVLCDPYGSIDIEGSGGSIVVTQPNGTVSAIAQAQFTGLLPNHEYIVFAMNLDCPGCSRWEDRICSQIAFGPFSQAGTFTTNANGHGVFQLKILDDHPKGVYELSLWINDPTVAPPSGLTLLVSDSFDVTIE